MACKPCKQIQLDDDLIQACLYGSLYKARELIDKGADVNLKNGWRWTPLDLAVWHDRKEIKRLLLKAGAKS